MDLKRTLGAAALFGLVTTVSAAEIWNHGFPVGGQLKWNGFDSGSTAVHVKLGATTYNGSGGQFKGFFYADGTQSADEFFRFFCIDLYQYASSGPHSYGASIHADDRLARLFDIAYPNKGLGDFYDGTSSSSFGKFSSGIFSSAFQLALWEIFYETSANLSLADGSFLSSTTANSSGTTEQQAVAQAQQWLTQVQGGAGSAAGWTLYKFTSATQQDYLSAVYREPPQITLNAVPEPGTLALLGFGVAALGALRRRA